MRSVTTLILTLSVVALTEGFHMKVSQGVVSDITVQIDQGVPQHLCHRILEKIEELMTETSRGLYEVTDTQLRFGDVTVIMPNSWLNSDCAAKADDKVFFNSGRSPDVKVTESTHPTFGVRPLALQYGQCSVQGKRVDIPHEALTANVSLSRNTLNAMMKEWIKFQFGVFEESGFLGDKLYPDTLVEGEEFVQNRGCNSSKKVICPLNESYDADVTTKQNILCQGKSARKVIQETIQAERQQQQQQISENDKNVTEEVNTSSSVEFRSPRFSFVLPQPQLFVLVLDRAAEENGLADGNNVLGDRDQKSWEILQQSLLGFINKLPAGSELSIVTYDDTAEMNLPPTIVTDANREGLHGRIPRRALDRGQVTNQRPCVQCGLKKAMELANSSKSANVIIATRSSTQSLFDMDLDVFKSVYEKTLPIHCIALNSLTIKQNWPQNYALTHFGSQHFLDVKNLASRPAMLSELSHILTAIASQTTGRQIISFHKDQRVPDPDNLVTGTFVVEESLRKDLWVMAMVEDERDIEAFEVLSPTGKKHSFPTFEQSLAYFKLSGLNEPGIWSYSVRLYQQLKKQYKVFIDILGEPVDIKEAIIVDSWMEKMYHKDKQRTDVFLYASVMQGSRPVLDAEVVALVTRPGVSDSLHQEVRITLRDLGTGYPDITEGDGIYSAYFSDFAPESGHYIIQIVATDNTGSAKTPKLSANLDADNNICCGSAIPISYTIPTSPFKRFVVGQSFYLEQPESFYLRHSSVKQSSENPPRLVSDVFPPSRVTDFATDSYLEDSLFVTLKWTAPGGDFDRGQAFRYEIRCYTNREALRDENFSEMSIPVHASLIPDPEPYGEEQRCTVGVPWPNEVFYYAIVAFDEAGNRGLISNTIAVYIKEEPATLTSDVNEISNGDGDLKRDLKFSQPLTHSEHPHFIIYIVSGLTGFVLVILIILSVVAIRRHYRTVKTSSMASSSSSTIDTEKAAYYDDEENSFSGTIKKLATYNSNNNHAGAKLMMSNGSSWIGGSSPTSDYSSQKSPLPSISEMVHQAFSSNQQLATSQELPAVHRIMMESGKEGSCTNASLHADMKKLEPDSPASIVHCPFPPRISVLEDFSVYRDLSHLGNGSQSNDYFSFTNMLSVANNGKKRHESLV